MRRQQQQQQKRQRRQQQQRRRHQTRQLARVDLIGIATGLQQKRRRRQTRQRRQATAGMIEVLVLVMIAVCATAAIVVHLSGYHHSGTECMAWIEMHHLHASTYWGTITIQNTGDYISTYELLAGTDKIKDISAVQPTEKTAVDFTINMTDKKPIEVVGTSINGSTRALCEVITG